MSMKAIQTFAWDADARTIDHLSGNGSFSFSVGKAIGIVCGLNNQNNGKDYFEIDYAFYIDSEGYQVIENGVYKTSNRIYTVDTVFKIERVNQKVRYFVDDDLIYTSLKTSTGVVFGDCSLYAYLDSVLDACLVDYDDVIPTSLSTIESRVREARDLLREVDSSFNQIYEIWEGVTDTLELLSEQNPSDTFTELLNSLINQVNFLLELDLGDAGKGIILKLINVILDLIDLGDESLLADFSIGLIPVGPLAAIGIDTAANVGYTGIGPLSVTSTEKDISQGRVAIGPVWAIGYDGEVAFGVARIGPLAAEGLDTAIIAPEINVGTAYLGPIGVYSYEGVLDVNTGTVGLGPLWALGSDDEVAVGSASIGPLWAWGHSRPANYLYAEWPSWSASLIQLAGNMAVMLTVPAPILTASANDFSNIQFNVTIPAPTLTAYTGGVTSLTVPAPVLTSTGTVQAVARAEMEVPSPELTATAANSTLVSVAIEVPAPVLTAATGAYASLEVLAPQLTAAGRVENLARVELTLPFIELTATATVGGMMTVEMEIPAPVLTATGVVGGVAQVALTLPAVVLTSTAQVSPGAGLPATAVVTETTYAINLTTGAVTTLLLGSLDKLITAHGRLYGLRSGELIRLDGNLDGAATIPATVRFAPQTFNTNRAKRLSTIYLDTREDDGLTLEVVADEETTWRYQTVTDNAPAYGTHKIKIGRGIKFHTAGIILYNRNGGRVDVGGMELLVEPLSRRPKT